MKLITEIFDDLAANDPRSESWLNRLNCINDCSDVKYQNVVASVNVDDDDAEEQLDTIALHRVLVSDQAAVSNKACYALLRKVQGALLHRTKVGENEEVFAAFRVITEHLKSL